MKNKYNLDFNEVLFGTDYFSNISEEEYNNKTDFAEKILLEYGHKDVLDNWTLYLKERVNTKKQAVSFMNWFFNYSILGIKCSNPYPFLVTLFKKLDLSLDETSANNDDNTFGLFDNIYVDMLINSGIKSRDDYFDINIFNDEEFIKAYNETIN